jgi:hypothetical protein
MSDFVLVQLLSFSHQLIPMDYGISFQSRRQYSKWNKQALTVESRHGTIVILY